MFHDRDEVHRSKSRAVGHFIKGQKYRWTVTWTEEGGCGGGGEVLSVSFIINLLAGIWLPASWTRSADGHILSLVLCTSQTSFIGPLSGTITLPLCDMLKLCLPSSHSSRLAFSPSLTLSTSNWPQVNVCVCVHAYMCVCASMCVWVGADLCWQICVC